MGSYERMSIGVTDHGWWSSACSVLGIDPLVIPAARGPDGNAYAADAHARLTNGAVVLERLRNHPVDYLIDNGGAGLSFVRENDSLDDVRLTHELANVTLCSHFIDPVVTAFQGMDWSIVWPCLNSPQWIKAVWDEAQVRELRRFGVPNVIHLPMAAVDRPYDTTPLDPDRCDPVVSFIGGQNTSFFTSGQSAPAHLLLPGVLAHAVAADLRDVCFLDVYYDLYKLAEPPADDDSAEVRLRKTADYYQAKLFYNAALCIRNRDRFVIFLKRTLGKRFRLIGKRWDTAYGLPTEPPIPDESGYFSCLRNSAININLVNGNAETAVNMRHFEITAAGGFMLCHDRPELSRYFEIGKECAVFTDEQDLLEKIDYYMRHPDERACIAQAGQRRTLNEHLYSHRLKTLLETLVSKQKRNPEPVSA